MKRAIGTILLVAASLQNAVPQTVAELQTARDYSAAIAQLQKERDNDPKKFEAADRDYLLARLAEKDGRLALAMSTYMNVSRRESLLRGYALARMSRIARSTGNLLLERIYLQHLAIENAENPLSNAAVDRIARNSIQSGNYVLAISFLNTNRTGTTSTRASDAAHKAYLRERQAMLGQAFLGLGNVEKARQIFANLLDTTPNPSQADDHAQVAAAALDRLDGGDAGADRVPELSGAEHLRRAGIYQFNRDFPAARRHYNALIAKFAANAEDAIFQIGRGYSQSGDHVEALKWYERVLERHAESTTAKDALLQAAAAYGRVGKPREAITRYQAFIEKYPKDEKLDRAYLNIVDLQRDQGSDQDALKWCTKTEEAFRGKPAEAVAVFAAARIHIAREEWPLAHAQLERLANFKDLGEATIPGGTSTTEASFLKAFVLEHQKHYAEAIDQYLEIPDGRGEYYGWRATERLLAMSEIEAAKPLLDGKIAALKNELSVKSAEVRFASARTLLRIATNAEVKASSLQVLRSTAKTLPKYANLTVPKADEPSPSDPAALRILELGLYDDAIDEFSPTQAEMFIKADRADLGLAIIEPIWKKVAADYPIELLPKDDLRLLYPAVFADDLIRESAERGVDPRLLLAIMRQESRFQPDAKSFAAARGLMQFISTTSTRVAGELEIKGFVQDDLYHPSNSILFGSHYVKTLFAAFPEQPEAVVASYNGGDDNMKRWLARSRSSLPERYVPEIMFTQTKDYVHKVMANYRMYKYLYDENLRAIDIGN